MKLIAVLLLSTAILLHAEVKVTVGEIADSRTTREGKIQLRCRVALRLEGDELAYCKGARIVLDRAIDDTGLDLRLRHGHLNVFARDERDFHAISKVARLDARPRAPLWNVHFTLRNPPRAAASLTVSGHLELLFPERDPKSVVAFDLERATSQPLEHEALQRAGAKITLIHSAGFTPSYRLTGAQGVVAAIEYCKADGTRLSSGWSYCPTGGTEKAVISLQEPIGPGAIARIFLATAKSVVRIPFQFASITLP